MEPERDLTCILFPGIVKNDQKALQCLGGVRSISQVYSQIKKSRLSLSYQPENPFVKKIYGDNRKTAGVLLKVKVKKSKIGDDVKKEVISTSIVGRVSCIYKFESLCDFQLMPAHREDNGPLKCALDVMIPSGTAPFSFLSEPCPLHIVPINFTRYEKPINYAYTSKRYLEKTDNAEDEENVHSTRRTVRTRQFNRYEFNLTNELPTEPHDGNIKQMKARLISYPQLKEEYETIKKLFEERPIWSLNLIKYETKILDSSLKIILPCLAVYIRKGPWKMVWVRFGYDPRKEPKARIYQSLDFRVRNQAGVSAMVTTRLAHYHKKLELVTDPKKSFNESSSELVSEGTVYFRPGVIPTQRQVYYQYCDIHLPEVQELVNAEPAPGYLCHATRGWLPPNMDQTCRDHIFKYVMETVLATHSAELKLEQASSEDDQISEDDDGKVSAVEFFDREDLYYREFPYRIQVVISGDYNYSDPKIQNEVELLTQKLENTSYISNSLYTESWLRTFINYVSRNNDYLNVTIDNEPDFIQNLKELWLFPANPFSLDVKFNEAGDRIIASRFLIQAINISGTNHEKEMVKVLRDVVAQSPLNASVFHPYFVFFDQFELVRPTSIQNLCYGALMMMITSFIFIPNILCSLWVAFSIISIEIGVVGYMALWDINLDSISMINLIMCIGFSVDFTAHICYAYMASKAKSPNDRVSECLYSLGLPIVQGSFSTILGVVALLLADSYIFSVFFKMVFMVIFFGAMHGLFLLPVLLSLFGPGSCTKQQEDIKMSKLEKMYPHPYCLPHPQLMLNDQIFNGKTINPNGVYKIYGDDKDLGIGTSGEDTSESSSNQSQRRQLDDESGRKKYEEGWKRSSYCQSASQFQPSGELDLFAHELDRNWQRQRYEDNRRVFENYRKAPMPRSRDDDWVGSARKTSDAGPRREGTYRVMRAHSHHNLHRPKAPRRSNSHQNLEHLDYVAEMRFP